MKPTQGRRPQAVMLSKRANVFYLEHVRVMQRDGLVVYLTEASDSLDQFVSIPDKNTAFVLLGKGTSITDAAVRMLSESNVLVGFCGSGGSPLFAATDCTFMLPQDEYRPTEYAQEWFAMWQNEERRLLAAKTFLRHRVAWLLRIARGAFDVPPNNLFDGFLLSVEKAKDTQTLLLAEAAYAKQMYRHFSGSFGLSDFVRESGNRKHDTPIAATNSYLDHGNYLAYGYAAVALHGLGIPFSLPVLHGKTRRGALVFDVADLMKDWLVMPLAFEAGASGWKADRFRAALIERALEVGALDECMTFLKSVTGIAHIDQ